MFFLQARPLHSFGPKAESLCAGGSYKRTNQFYRTRARRVNTNIITVIREMISVQRSTASIQYMIHARIMSLCTWLCACVRAWTSLRASASRFVFFGATVATGCNPSRTRWPENQDKRVVVVALYNVMCRIMFGIIIPKHNIYIHMYWPPTQHPKSRAQYENINR
jgi:hypothetical protein